MQTNNITTYNYQEIVYAITTFILATMEHLLINKCSSIFLHVFINVSDGQIRVHEFINELFHHNNDKYWDKIRKYNFKTSLLTWIHVILIKLPSVKRTVLIKSTESETIRDLVMMIHY